MDENSAVSTKTKRAAKRKRQRLAKAEEKRKLKQEKAGDPVQTAREKAKQSDDPVQALRDSSITNSSTPAPAQDAVRPLSSPGLTHKPKPTPEAYFVDVCHPDPVAINTRIGSDYRTFYGYIPRDILGEIFEFCLPVDMSRRSKKNEAPLVLAHVCRHWRNVALNTSSLWVAFSLVTRKDKKNKKDPLMHQKLLSLFLERSRLRPIKFAISAPADDRLLRVLLSRVARWKEVTVVFNESQAFADLFFTMNWAPMVESLVVDATCCTDFDEKILPKVPAVTHNMPNLRRLRWLSRKSLPVTQFLDISLGNLAHLDLWCPLSMENCLKILGCCLRLITLKLDLKKESRAIPALGNYIDIPTLTHLDVTPYCEVAKFLCHFNLPALRFIRIMHRRYFTHNPLGLEDFCTRSCCTLETFWLNDRHMAYTCVMEYLQLPCLQSIRELHFFASAVDDTCIESLMVP
ncbi:hypothetical protein H0H81_000494 [Sphagnurus paluster]|uniref:F-box domain-containing protein n=1 Tax=Sphagnurus paluster TaxID=117069 RepID=A0A9P7FW62_9AGAR|nr:hypothetical protein H0H81_000494 [Sphagnurus paluster]